MEYAFSHEGKVFTPDGIVNGIGDTDRYNIELEAKEIAWLKTDPDKVFLYVKHPAKHYDGLGNVPPIDVDYAWKVTTWLGTVVCSYAHVGQRKVMGFGFHSYRRAISAVIFGTLYHGWYFESSGSYCRLTKAKNQFPSWRPRPKQ